MNRVSVLCLSLLLCSLSGAELQDNEIEQRKASPESGNVPEQPQSDLHAVLRDMSANLAEHKLMIQQLQTLNQAQAAEIETLKQQQQDQAVELSSMMERTHLTETHVESLKRGRGAGQVAFSASLVASGQITLGPFNTHTPVVFRHVISNIGNAYNPYTGIFTAPVRGAYHFQFYIIAPMDGTYASWVYLEKNGGKVVAAYERQQNMWGSSSDAVILLLEAQDVVCVRLQQNTRIYDDQDHFSTFSGHLLFPM